MVRERQTVSVSEMKSDRLYTVKGTRILHRRLEGGKLEKYEGGQWVEVKVTKERLMHMKLREY